MINNPYLDTIISLVLIYALLSTLVSIITEWLNQQLKTRSIFLKDTIHKMVNDTSNHNYGYLLYRHPIVDRFRKDNQSLPQYVSAEVFSQALIEVVANSVNTDKIKIDTDGTHKLIADPKNAPNAPDLFARFSSAVDKMNYSDTKRLFQHFIDRSENSGADTSKREKLEKEITNWYNEHMDRATGWYKTQQRPKLLAIGFLVALFLNADSIHLTRVLLMNSSLRNSMVGFAEKAADTYSSVPDSLAVEKINITIDSLNLMIQRNKATKDSSQNSPLQVKFNKLNTVQKSINKRLGLLTNDRDSLPEVSLNRQLKLIDKLSYYGLPIGYQDDAPPVSWKKDFLRIKNNSKKGVCTDTSIDSETYFEYRKHLTVTNFITYLLGILITGFSLSFGAPFWFDILVKFVNIRRGGVKPEEKTIAKK